MLFVVRDPTAFIFFLICNSLLSLEVLASPVVRIMPLGDSITVGNRYPGGYRKKLYDNLKSHDFNVDFVGTRDTNSAQDMDPHHQGQGGKTISFIAEHIETWLDQIEYPDIILLHIGINDFRKHDDIQNAIYRFDALVDKISRLRPLSNIITTNLLSQPSDQVDQIQTLFNNFLETVVDGHVKLGRRVWYVEMNIPRKHLMYHGIHPNQKGYDIMADIWTSAILNIMGPEGDKFPPEVLHIQSKPNHQEFQINFSKPISDKSVKDLRTFRISNDISVKEATLSEDKREIVIKTSDYSHMKNQYVEIFIEPSGIVDRTPLQLYLTTGSGRNGEPLSIFIESTEPTASPGTSSRKKTFYIVFNEKINNKEWCLSGVTKYFNVGEKVVLYQCRGNKGQKWTIDQEGKIASHAYPDKCISSQENFLTIEKCKNNDEDFFWIYSYFESKLLQVKDVSKAVTIGEYKPAARYEVQLLPSERSSQSKSQMWSIKS